MLYTQINMDDPGFLLALIDAASERGKDCPAQDEKEAMDKIAVGALEQLPLAKMRKDLSDED